MLKRYFSLLLFIATMHASFAFANEALPYTITNETHQQSGLAMATVTLNDQKFMVELAQTASEQATGLMNRLILPVEQGMLFIFPAPTKPVFWMKNTKIPLDILFFDENAQLTQIYHSAPPCINEPCEHYPATQTSKYVLELAAGVAKKYQIQEGMSLQP